MDNGLQGNVRLRRFGNLDRPYIASLYCQLTTAAAMGRALHEKNSRKRDKNLAMAFVNFYRVSHIVTFLPDSKKGIAHRFQKPIFQIQGGSVVRIYSPPRHYVYT
jgi:hypothetical protein